MWGDVVGNEGRRVTRPGERHVPTSEDRYWAERAATVGETSLADLRATAEKWRGGLTALTGIVAAALAVGAPFVHGVVASPVARNLIGAGIILAVLSLGIASWAAMNAAFGSPGDIQNNGDALRIWSDTAATSALAQLKRAKVGTLVGFSLLIVTASIGIFGSSTTPAPSRVTLTDTSQLCGTVSFQGGGSVVDVVAPNGTIVSQPLADVRSIEFETGCG
jgi:hypothetical protein